MRRITIERMHLVNFKGMRDFTLDFYKKGMSICGRNGIGKTTIFDAFTWLLFGKNSEDKKQFGIKTIGEDGNVIPKIPHEVTAIIDVDGEKVSLTRRINEKWTKRRGSEQEEYTGNEEERVYNDVPMSTKEWDAKIGALCTEQVFKFITNPRYFTSQKPDVQRAMLCKMAGDITNEDIAAGDEDFMALLSGMGSKTLDEYKREIAAAKKRVDDEVKGIPARTDELQREMAALGDVDFYEIESKLSVERDAMAKVDAIIADQSKLLAEANKQRTGKQRQLTQLNDARYRIESEIRHQAHVAYTEATADKRMAELKLEELKKYLGRLQNEMRQMQKMQEQYSKNREVLIADWRKISASKLVFDKDMFCCPTCKRMMEPADIEAKQEEMTRNFNETKANMLMENNRKGKANKAVLDEVVAHIAESHKNIEEAEAEIKSIETSEAYNKTVEQPDVERMIAESELWQQANEAVNALKAQLDDEEHTQTIDNTPYREEKSRIAAAMQELNKELAKKDMAERIKRRMAELETAYKNGMQRMAELERTEYTIARFRKAHIAEVDRRINGMFKLVKWKMYETQINGGEAETCKAMVNGVDFDNQNNAMQVNMGLDIINTISRFEGVQAPIVIDNAESLNSTIDTDAQKILLVVSEDKEITIK